jgi:hypothetical protein
LLQPNDAPFGMPQNRSRHIEGGGRDSTTWNHEGVWQRDTPFQILNLCFHTARKLRRHDHEVLLQFGVLGGIRRQLCADCEELALNTQDHGVPFSVLQLCPCGAERRNSLIDGAISLRAGIRLGDAAAI